MKTPLDYYHVWLEKNHFLANPEQEKVLKYLGQVQKELQQSASQKFWSFNFIPFKKSIKGLYLWGGVGVGKTLIMDFFFQSLNAPKLRLHFHAFLHRIHQELKLLPGQANPLMVIAKKLAVEFRILCFDEFIVSDVADAMMMAELFKALFDHGICLVATSNLAPEQLYENGLQRQRFLPVIDLIHQHTSVIHLSLTHDYRRQILEHIPVYYCPLGEQAEQSMWHSFQKFADDLHLLTEQSLVLLDREIKVKQRTSKVIWFEFKDICGRPRSQEDYLQLVRQYQIILVSNVPDFTKVSADLIVSFVHLVDIVYDSRRQLIISAAREIEQLYPQGAFRKIFQRTESRLLEMQDKRYLLKFT